MRHIVALLVILTSFASLCARAQEVGNPEIQAPESRQEMSVAEDCNAAIRDRAAAGEGPFKVIITFKPSEGYDALKDDEKVIANHKLQRAFMDSMGWGKGDDHGVVRFHFIPSMGADLTAKEVEAALKDPTVSCIQQDIPASPM